MDVSEICPLSQAAVAQLLTSRLAEHGAASDVCRRSAVRWSFPGTVELWVPGRNGEEYELATSINLSTSGVGIRLDHALRPGTKLAIAIHEPEVSFHGRAVVRHCTETERGYYLAGLEFLFENQ
jgi:hypothetical protein